MPHRSASAELEWQICSVRSRSSSSCVRAGDPLARRTCSVQAQRSSRLPVLGLNLSPYRNSTSNGKWLTLLSMEAINSSRGDEDFRAINFLPSFRENSCDPPRATRRSRRVFSDFCDVLVPGLTWQLLLRPLQCFSSFTSSKAVCSKICRSSL